jgi:hypothetical protein
MVGIEEDWVITLEKFLASKNEIFKIYTNGETEELRSVWYYRTFDEATAIYQAGFVDGEGINFVSVESSKNLCLWQFRVRTFVSTILYHLERILKLAS